MDKFNQINYFLTKNNPYWFSLFRFIVGMMMAVNHGFGKIIGGPEKWTKLGSLGLTSLGIDSFHTTFGFLASFSEFFGGILLAIGLFVRPTSALLVINMTVAVLYHLISGKGSSEFAILYGIVFFYFMLAGPGKISLDAKLFLNNK